MKNLLLSLLAVLPFAAFSANPVVVTSSIITNNTICSSADDPVLYEFIVTDADGDVITVSNIVSNAPAVMDASTVFYDNFQVIGNDYYFRFYGPPADLGIFQLSVTFTDGGLSANILLPEIEIVPELILGVTPSLIEMCTNNGKVDFDNYVNVPGGSYSNGEYEIDFDYGLFDTDNSPISTEDTIEIYYTLYQYQCYFETTFEAVIYSSASVGVESTAATCGNADGSAEVFLDAPGGTTILWSNGVQDQTLNTGLTSGSYSVLVTTPQGCSSQEFIQVGIDGVSLESSVTNVNCFGLSDGSITIDPTGLTAPLSVLWSSGHSTEDISGLPAGYYTVSITDATGCNYSETIQIYAPDEIFVDAIIDRPTCGEEDGSIEIDQQFGGSGEFSFSWNNGDSGEFIEDLGADIYTATITDEHGCIQTKTFYLSDEDAADLYGDIYPAACDGAGGAIYVSAYPNGGSFIQSVDWSSGQNTLSITDVAADNYICTLVTSNGCVAIKGWNVPVVEPLQNNICVVTVDDETTTNLVVWEKVQPEGIDYYKIYRETSVPGNFAFIDTVSASGESLFNDVVASPVERSWKYKISAVNFCGTEGPLSLPHQTIHLDVVENSTSDGVIITWNPYIGTSFSNYFVSRYTDVNGWEENIATLSPTQLTFEDDVPITTPGLDYVVEMELDIMCVAEKSQDFNSSRSNKDKAQFLPGNGTGDSNNGLEEAYLLSIGIAPNPVTSDLMIYQLDQEELNITILNPEGQVVMKQTVGDISNTVSMEGLASGIYMVNIQLNSTSQTFRIVKI